ncbi:MAG: hypothetical protein JW889_14265 [Verrucomicrobia bacterium]|nr:hypothetical protein [Verrucomicrobiota bacterium]
MLRPQDIQEFYALLDEEIADFDCGAVCAARNRNKMPYCCDISKAIPLMYFDEYEYVRRHSAMWRPYVPKDPKEKLDELEYHLFVECPGPARCERPWRSIVCRIFPTYPYVDDDERAVGLFFNTCLRDKCHLVGRPELVRQAFIRNHVQFWNLLFERHEGEKAFHVNLCRQTEARHRRLRKPFIVMMPDGTLTRRFDNGAGDEWTPR